MTSYSWEFVSLVCYSVVPPFANVVYSVKWARRALSDDGLSVVLYGETTLPEPAATDAFVPFRDLSPEIVSSWVAGVIGSEEQGRLDGVLEAEIERQRAPATVELPPPWYNASVG